MQDNNIYNDLLGPHTEAAKLMERTQKVAGPIGVSALRIQMLAETDSLTKLKNIYAMKNELNSIIANPGPNPERYVFMFMDLDGFKSVNDTYGHKAGDDVLKAVGDRLELRESDIVGRLGGDEFLIIVDTENKVPDRRGDHRIEPNPRRKRQSRSEVIRGLSEHIRDEVVSAGINAGYSGIAASIGVVELNGFTNAEQVIEAADKRMYVDKASRKNPTGLTPASTS